MLRAIEEFFDQIGFAGSYSDYVDFRYGFRMQGFSNPCLMTQVIPWTDVFCPFLDSEAYNFGASMRLDGIANRLGQIRWGLDHLPSIDALPRIKAGVKTMEPADLSCRGRFDSNITPRAAAVAEAMVMLVLAAVEISP